MLFGDSDAGSWTPAFDQLFKVLGYRLDVFGFIGCTTAPVNRPRPPSPGFPGQWKLCDTWHAKLRRGAKGGAGRDHRGVVAVDDGRLGQRVQLGGRDGGPVQQDDDRGPEHRPRCHGHDPAVPVLGAGLPRGAPDGGPGLQRELLEPHSYYAGLLARDAKVATAAHATLIPAWQWFCAQSQCSPVIGKYLVSIDRNHVSEPYMIFIDEVLAAAFVNDVKL